MSSRIGSDYAARLEQDVEVLRSWASGIDRSQLYRPPPDGEWTVMENLVHVVEFLPYWADQLALVVRSPGQPFGRTHEDPDRIAAVEDHARDEVDDVLERLAQAGEHAAASLRALPDDSWDLMGVHRRGEMTLREITEFFLVDHLADHIEQARAALAALDGGRAEGGRQPDAPPREVK